MRGNPTFRKARNVGHPAKACHFPRPKREICVESHVSKGRNVATRPPPRAATSCELLGTCNSVESSTRAHSRSGMRLRRASEMVNFAQTSESHEIYKSGKPFTGTHPDAQFGCCEGQGDI